jgi:endoglucanase
MILTPGIFSAYLAGLKGVVSHITAAKNYAVVDAHNYGRYPWDNNNGPVINSTSDFKAFWKNVATEFASDSNVIFDCNNEYNGLDKDHNKELEILTSLNQACIDGIRAAGATSQYIFIEGTVSLLLSISESDSDRNCRVGQAHCTGSTLEAVMPYLI